MVAGPQTLAAPSGTGAPALLSRIGLDRSTLLAYATLLSGQVGRLVFSLAYFLVLANALSLEAFGLFATASATGVVLSRVGAFGFVSPLYRAACTRRRLVGTYLAGYLAALLVSLPLVAGVAALVFAVVFRGEMSAGAFALVVVSEVLLWRTAEVLVVVNNGLARFGRAAALVIANTALRAGAAAAFMVAGTGAAGTGGLDGWAWFYAGANALSLLAALAWLWPRSRLRPGPRLRPAPRLWLARWRDAAGVAGAEVLFYLQSELDKLLVLALGGPLIAGLYAIVMRLADLTAIPLRSMTTLLIQRIMRERGRRRPWRLWAALEGLTVAVSVAGMGALALALNLAPGLLGQNVATAAPYVALALLLPAFRNLVEFHTELLYAFERTGERLVQLAGVGLFKALLLAALLAALTRFGPIAVWLNGLFAALYVVSALYTYRTLTRAPASARS